MPILPVKLPDTMFLVCDHVYHHRLNLCTQDDAIEFFGSGTALSKMYAKMKRLFLAIQGSCTRANGQTDEQFKELVLHKAREFDKANNMSSIKRTSAQVLDHCDMFRQNVKRRKKKNLQSTKMGRANTMARECAIHGDTVVTCPFCHSFDANASPPCNCSNCHHMRATNESITEVDL